MLQRRNSTDKPHQILGTFASCGMDAVSISEKMKSRVEANQYTRGALSEISRSIVLLTEKISGAVKEQSTLSEHTARKF